MYIFLHEERSKGYLEEGEVLPHLRFSHKQTGDPTPLQPLRMRVMLQLSEQDMPDVK